MEALDISDETAQTASLNSRETSDGWRRGSDASHASKDDPGRVVALEKVETPVHRRWEATALICTVVVVEWASVSMCVGEFR